ncbi:MAG: hypothetical protein DWI57_08675 [Chloroflexi bacterium]|nr:MAG: hypothetical protein DWI57_08675 [Chloroflexota bacterium]
MPIRPFAPGDALLVQRLSRYATRFHIGRFLLQPSSPLQAAFSAYLPWAYRSGITYVLRQEEHGLARAGFVQWQLHPGRAEADLLALSPALDAPNGHPAVWHKLLAESALALADQQFRRLYSELSDQPLLVNTFMQAGFHLYARETIWRLATEPLAFAASAGTALRPQSGQDRWALEQLYARITPAPVRQAEAVDGEGGQFAPPILFNRHRHQPLTSFVLDGADGLVGCVQIIWGKTGVWLRLWVDSNDPDTSRVHLLLRHGLQQIAGASARGPVYCAVRDYQSGLSSILEEYGFAPFTDRVRMMRPIWQRAKKAVENRLPSLEGVAEAMPGSLVMPQATSERRGTMELLTPRVRTAHNRSEKSDVTT